MTDQAGFLQGCLSELIQNTTDGSKMAQVKPLVESIADFLQNCSNECALNVGKHAISLINKSQFLDIADKKFRRLVAEVYGVREDYLAAAPVLEGIQFNNSDKPEDVIERITVW